MAIQAPKDWFEKELQASVTADPSKIEGFDGTLYFNITGDNGGEWGVKIGEGKVETSAGAPDSPKITITMKDGDFVDFINGKLSGQMAFMTGKLKFKGDMGLAMKLQKLL